MLCQLVPSRRPSMMFLFIGPSVSSSLPLPVGYPPELASTGDLIFMFPCFGSFTGDFPPAEASAKEGHPICNAPVLGAHNTMETNCHSAALHGSRSS